VEGSRAVGYVESDDEALAGGLNRISVRGDGADLRSGRVGGHGSIVTLTTSVKNK
jgi:hypothetical protein